MKKTIIFTLVLSFVFLCSCMKRNNQDDINSTAGYYVTSEQTSVAKVDIKPSNEKNIELYTDFLIKRYNEIRDSWSSDKFNTDLSEEGFEKDILLWYDSYYYFYDMDNDGMEEMLLGGQVKMGNDIDALDIVRKLCITSVYAVKNNQVVQIDGDIRTLGQEYILDQILYSNGLIVTEYGNEVNPSYYMLAYENGKLIDKCDFAHYGDDSYVRLYDQGSRISNEAEYKQIYETACGKAAKVDIDWKPITEIMNRVQER